MLLQRICLMVAAFFAAGTVFAAGEAGLELRTVKPGTLVAIERAVADGTVVVSVSDTGGNPVLGLGPADFSVTRAGRGGNVVSATPIAEDLERPRHFVLVLDNSSSIMHRDAVQPLLAGVANLLNIVRPSDEVQMVVFTEGMTATHGGRDLNVRTFRSSNPSELLAFAKKAYTDDEMTHTTVLYEGMLAGLDLLAKMPAGEPRFLVVFSDGEDINSDFKTEEVMREGGQVPGGFNAYAIDYMPEPEVDPFLNRFVTANRGRIWKAEVESSLPQIFQSLATRMLHSYIVTYNFPPSGAVAVSPGILKVDVVRCMGNVTDVAVEPAEVTLRPAVEGDVARWKALVATGSGTIAENSGEGAPAPEVKLALPKEKGAELAQGGSLAVTMEVEDSRGEKVLISAAPVTLDVTQTQGHLAVEPAALTVQEVTTVDASPMLGHIYFAKGQREIPPTYVRFATAEERAGFDEQTPADAFEKHCQLLNVVGRRLAANPETKITLVGCNDNTGGERGNRKLSAERADAVRKYLQTVWGIAPERMKVETRNLPRIPSTSRLPEGQAENRRVELLSTDKELLAPVTSTDVEMQIDRQVLKVRPDVTAPYGIQTWKINASNAAGSVAEVAGADLPAETAIDLAKADYRSLASSGDINVMMELQDRKGQKMMLACPPTKVKYLQTSRSAGVRDGQLIREKYGLILFDFDRAEISRRDRDFLEGIAARFNTLPEATLSIVGHTDSIGAEDYNQKLSQRRAAAVYEVVTAAAGDAGGRISHEGAGMNAPLFDNDTPQGRALNRTVTMTLEYRAPDQ